MMIGKVYFPQFSSFPFGMLHAHEPMAIVVLIVVFAAVLTAFCMWVIR